MASQNPGVTASPLRSALWSGVAGVVFATVAVLIGSLAQARINPAVVGQPGEVTAANMFAGVLLCGALLWWLLVARSQHVELLRGAVAGVLVACLSYPVVLLLAEFFNADPESIRFEAGTILQRLLSILAHSAFGLLTTGFASTLLLALAGVLIAWFERRMTAPPDPPRAGGSVMRPVFRGIAIAAASVLVVLVGTFAFLTLWPIPPLAEQPVPAPAADYEAAMARFSVLEAAEAKLPLRPECRSQLRSHGNKVAMTVIYLHGLTSCPAQGEALATELYGRGYNVLLPRLPGHGEANPLTLALAHVTAEEFVATTEDAVEMAHGLGDEVVVIGLSAGGALTAYEIQHGRGLANAVAVAPFLGPAFLPPWSTKAATNLLLLLPNIMVWWNAKKPYPDPEIPYLYPRFATRAVAELMRIGQLVLAEGVSTPPAAERRGVLLNEADRTISNRLAENLVSEWNRHGGRVDLRILPAADALPSALWRGAGRRL